ncbi:50S ribosomal protein L4 [Candidatus Gracilibacteria bacterium]|nr:50S ribosomal protein L4 [Candidatus Gracilibacteria bacterium]
MNIPVYKQDGSRAGEVAVSEKFFGQELNAGLIHRIFVLQVSNGRAALAHTLTKGEVRGGGKKPHNQKHTGWARTGSSRNPHWKGGGVALGPRSNRNYRISASKNERRIALFSALSDKMKGEQISALESYAGDKPRTKDFATMLSKLPFKKKILFVLPERNDAFYRSCRNIPHVKSILVNYLNIKDILDYNDVVFLKDALPRLDTIFSKAK